MSKINPKFKALSLEDRVELLTLTTGVIIFTSGMKEEHANNGDSELCKILSQEREFLKKEVFQFYKDHDFEGIFE